jgi:putative membrane protein
VPSGIVREAYQAGCTGKDRRSARSAEPVLHCTEHAMSPEAASVHHDRFEVRVTADSHFSWLRTRLSVERTLMAWMRTATALIGFGFTIVQFFERFEDMRDVTSAAYPNGPRYLGLALIGAGVLGLAVSLWQYSLVNRHLWSGQFRPLAGIGEEQMTVPTVFVAVVVLFIGIFTFAAVAFRYV